MTAQCFEKIAAGLQEALAVACGKGEPARVHPTFVSAFMVVCSTCGNKRCPKATDPRLGCTGSNEPGQIGSRYA